MSSQLKIERVKLIFNCKLCHKLTMWLNNMSILFKKDQKVVDCTIVDLVDLLICQQYEC